MLLVKETLFCLLCKSRKNSVIDGRWFVRLLLSFRGHENLLHLTPLGVRWNLSGHSPMTEEPDVFVTKVLCDVTGSGVSLGCLYSVSLNIVSLQQKKWSIFSISHLGASTHYLKGRGRLRINLGVT